MVVLPNRTEVFVRTESDQAPTTQSTRVSFIGSQRNHKVDEVDLDDDVERGPEK